MLISDARRALFVHVPKTGGVSVGVTFTRTCPDARSKAPGVVPPLGRHAPYARILRAEPGVADYWSFAFVRNPWARMVSWWSMIDDWNREWGPASGRPQEGERKMRGNDLWRAAAAYSGFEEFVLRGTDELPRLGRPQVDYLRAPGREVDFVGRTESFAEDLAEVERRLGGDPTPVPHRNRSPHGSYRDYYTSATRDRVAEVYAADLEAFGYAF
ncbi:sulfotransferase family 2 domain-containing protein [Nocardioides sp. J2M5]|uniref:sulfotransferase family 2 domain-containing protein n=1 Tax=Nocardioides palaemonis TaxID=2829810 RepID=UPI001BA82F8E|nr:sulfotransferase family 2 domain-containing protein [Nocardioides palaemonis]MBS2937758.1 sulfotransferase family 2 domain-containing protein [Nocardioides palaemonis]